jgi:mannose-6-phosphate isomerase-like protein (cupin superfamily)
MIMENNLALLDPATGEHVLVTKTGRETNGKYIQGVSTYPSSLAFPSYHEHPRQEEQLDIVAGTVLVRIEGKLQFAGPGARVVIPAGAAHEIANAGTEPAEVVWQFQPALRTDDYLEATLAPAGAQKVGRWRRMLERVSVAAEFSNEYRKATMPWIVQRPFLAVLGRLVKRPCRDNMAVFVNERSTQPRPLFGEQLRCTG